MNNSHHFDGSLLIDLFAKHYSFQISILSHNVHRSITVKIFFRVVYIVKTFLVILCNPLQKFYGEKFTESCKGETGGGRWRIKESCSIIMEFCYLNRFIFPLANPTRKYKNGKNPGRETGTRIKFVNEIYKQGFIEQANWMHKIDSVYGSTEMWNRGGLHKVGLLGVFNSNFLHFIPLEANKITQNLTFDGRCKLNCLTTCANASGFWTTMESRI